MHQGQFCIYYSTITSLKRQFIAVQPRVCQLKVDGSPTICECQANELLADSLFAPGATFNNVSGDQTNINRVDVNLTIDNTPPPSVHRDQTSINRANVNVNLTIADNTPPSVHRDQTNVSRVDVNLTIVDNTPPPSNHPVVALLVVIISLLLAIVGLLLYQVSTNPTV
jgi:hypothetical protein